MKKLDKVIVTSATTSADKVNFQLTDREEVSK
jgi:hypothetical protein